MVPVQAGTHKGGCQCFISPRCVIVSPSCFNFFTSKRVARRARRSASGAAFRQSDFERYPRAGEHWKDAVSCPRCGCLRSTFSDPVAAVLGWSGSAAASLHDRYFASAPKRSHGFAIQALAAIILWVARWARSSALVHG